jgi:acyl carrier protein
VTSVTDITIHHTIRDALKLPGDYPIDGSAAPGDVPGWDSLAWINLMAAVESEYAIVLPLEELSEIETVGGFCALVRRLTA